MDRLRIEPQIKTRGRRPITRDQAPVVFFAMVIAAGLFTMIDTGPPAPVAHAAPPRGETWPGAWPFKADRISLSCRALGADRAPAVFVKVDDETYGLNSVAASIAGSPRPILAEGADPQPLIARGAALCAADSGPLAIRRS